MTSVAQRHDDSGDFSDGSQDIEHSNSGIDGGPVESDYDSQGSESDHSERDPDSQDGQETERRVDDDEDRSNPQYIPKRGTFYEHDDRTAASGEESKDTASEQSTEKKDGSESTTERRRPPRKSDIINKWSHDKYNENEQMPKSREELVAIYGYDIRNEDAPPHARRNRRYGRGPNKYTRTWEDEDAYRRQTAQQQTPRKPPTAEDFPELDTSNRYTRRPRAPRPRSKSQPNSNESLENGTSLHRNASIKVVKKPAIKTGVRNAPVKTSVKITPKNEEKMPAIENLTITASVVNSEGPARRVAPQVAQQRPVPTDVRKKPTQQPVVSNNSQSKPQQQQTQPQQKPPPQQQQTQQPQPQGGEQRSGSKRYSSLRQRPLAEPYAPQQQQQVPQQQVPQQQVPQQQPQQQQVPQPLPQQQQPQLPQQQPHRYIPAGNGGEFNSTHQGSPAHPSHQHIMHQQVVRQGPAPPHASSPPRQPAHPTQRVQLGILEQQQLVQHQHHSLHNMPQPHATQPLIGQLQPSQGYAPPAMMPAQYMQVQNDFQSGSGAVFGSPMYQPQPQYTHPQMYPHHNYVSAQATQAGGVTYFTCTEQETAPRATRRPTAAIPILKPHPPDRPANSTEKDNIDRIVENMFVRKPWPAQGQSADSKEKSQSERSSSEPAQKDQSQPSSLTSSTISNESKPEKSEEKEKSEVREVPREVPREVREVSREVETTIQESISNEA